MALRELLLNSIKALRVKVTPAGDITSTNVQDALEEIDSVSSTALQNIVEDTTPQLGGDLDGQGNYAVDLQNFPDMLAGQGPGYWFDGVDDYIICDDPTFDTGDFYIHYVGIPPNINSTTIQRILSKHADAANRWHFSVSNGGSSFYAQIGGTAVQYSSGEIAFTENTIYSITLVVSQATTTATGNIYFYVNGKLHNSISLSSGLTTFAVAASIYHMRNLSAAPYYVSGSTNYISAGNLALSESEVKALSSGAPIPYKYLGASQTNLFANSGFDADTDWTKGDGWTISDGAAHHSTTIGGTLYQTGLLAPGKAYRLTFDVTAYTSGDLKGQFGSSETDSIGITGTGTFTIEAISDSFLCGLISVDTFTGSVDNVTVVQIGCVLDLNHSGIGHNTWQDVSGNQLHGAVSGALPINTPADHSEKYIDLTVTGDTSFTLPAGYIIDSIVLDSDGAIGGGIDIGTTNGGGEIVAAEAVAGAGKVLCTLVAGANYNLTGADDIIYITDADGTGWDSATVAFTVGMARKEL